MEVHITARHLKLTPAIAEYVQKKLEKAKRFFDHLISAQVILDVTKNRHSSEIVLHASGRSFRAKEESTDLYAAIDLMTDKIDAQLRRHKEKLRVHRPTRKGRSRSEIWPEPASASALELSDARISSLRVLRLVPQSLIEAMNAMEKSDTAHWIFLNSDNQRVTVLYRKPDKTYGVVESIA